MKCDGAYDVKPYCLNKHYQRMSENNEQEWAYALEHLWWTQPWLAMFGPFLIPMSWMFSWMFLIFPGTKPDIDTAMDLKGKPFSKFWFTMV